MRGSEQARKLEITGAGIRVEVEGRGIRDNLWSLAEGTGKGGWSWL